jgi:myo-inositol-1(or 4)-monophosphatase
LTASPNGKKPQRFGCGAAGIPFGAVSLPRRHAFSRTLVAIMPPVAGVRCFGSAALDLARVGAGRYEGHWELGDKSWNIAAGILMVREAGGYATGTADGAPGKTAAIAAANPHKPPAVTGNRN